MKFEKLDYLKEDNKITLIGGNSDKIVRLTISNGELSNQTINGFPGDLKSVTMSSVNSFLVINRSPTVQYYRQTSDYAQEETIEDFYLENDLFLLDYSVDFSVSFNLALSEAKNYGLVETFKEVDFFYLTS
jgi:hypothetical protein